MWNVVKADVNRIIRSKSFIVMPVVILLMVTVLCGLFAGLKYVMSLDLSAVLGDSMDSLASIGSIADNGFDMTMMNLQSDTLIYVFIVILLSVSAFDFSCGTVKNLLSIGKSKKKIYFAKLFTSYIWTILGVIFYAIVSTGMSYLFFQSPMNGDEITKILLITIKQLPIYLSIITIGHACVFMTQKITSSMLIYIGSFMFFETIMPIIDLILDWPFKVSLLMPLYQLIELTSVEISTASYLTIYISSVVYIVVGAIFGYWMFKRSEIK
jgi:ABC-2 type transport system permease protein